MNKDKNASSMKKDEQGPNEGNKLGRNRKWMEMEGNSVLSWSSNVEQLSRITLATKPRRRNRPSRPIHQQHAWLGVSDVSHCLTTLVAEKAVFVSDLFITIFHRVFACLHNMFCIVLQ